MKKLYILVIVLFVFTGCKKSSTSENTIIGKWKITQELAIYYVNNVEVYREILALSGGANSYVEFKPDGSFILNGSVNGSYITYTGTYILTNNNTSLRTTITGSSPGPDQLFTFVDNNTFTTSNTATGGGTTTYIKNGVNYTANGETVITTFVRF
ncbi:hypothetical protein KXQ82_12245 [Mucilaginibacter sp. HMF5004]|uniref:hypothetical protein n=1 Tax=Mucilaginibacter rivuli TaxID=2857527 RepID=UPI001C5EC68D|nr:hypothetical protein [Mucilaginibacter rivuli]MBW4890497.1 hypothetical protein [Mucilaginibacter rivuli]